jgi:hypothetical protein
MRARIASSAMASYLRTALHDGSTVMLIPCLVMWTAAAVGLHRLGR